MASIAVIGLTSVGLYIYREIAGSTADPTASSRSGDCYEPSSSLGFGDVIGDRREYGIILSVL